MKWGEYMQLTPMENWILEKTNLRENSLVELETYQLTQLKDILSYAKQNSRFYKKHLEHIDVESIHSLKDFKKIPYTLQENIKENSMEFLCVSQSEVKRIVTLNTSGTFTNEKRIYFTEEDLNLTIEFFKVGMKCLIDDKDHVLVLLPGKAYGTIGDLLKKALTQLNIKCIVQGVLTDTEATAKCIEDNQITCLVGIPMQVLYFSRKKSEVFKRIKKVLLSADYVPDVLVKELTNKFHCQVFGHYGMTEMGYGGGVECQALNGYHMRDGDLYFEIIDPITGDVVEDGELGEVVFTTFKRQAMPLIRYRTGDIASFSKEKCNCGTFLKTMKKVQGRLDNKIVLDMNTVIHLREFDEIVLKFPQIIDYNITVFNDNLLVFKFILENDTDWIIIKKVLAEEIHKGFDYKLNIEFIRESENKILKVTNSMIKRKIHDAKKGE
jgi:phenylacetate-coenzyme A ligase PaaK-like adenylate-forming protein